MKPLDALIKLLQPKAAQAAVTVSTPPETGLLEQIFMGSSSKPMTPNVKPETARYDVSLQEVGKEMKNQAQNDIKTAIEKATREGSKDESMAYYTSKGKQYHANTWDKFKYDLGLYPDILFNKMPATFSEAFKFYASQPRVQRWNPFSQLNAVLRMNVPQAGAYRQEVDELLKPFHPQLPEIPSPYNQIPLPGNGLPIGVAEDFAQGMINAPARAVGGVARYPAIRSFPELGRDLLDVILGISTILGTKDIASGALSSGATPEVVKVVGKPFVQTVNPSDFAEQQAGWPKGLKAQFNAAVMTKDAKKMLELLPSVPKAYQKQFAGEISRALAQASALPPANPSAVKTSLPTDVKIDPVGAIHFMQQAPNVLRNALGETGLTPGVIPL